MPRGDGTGPAGRGPRTGRSAGYCAGFDMPGYANQSFRFGRGLGRGRGFGWRMFGFAPAVPYQEPTKQEEIAMLENQEKALEEEQKFLKNESEQIKKRIAELKAKKK